MAVIWSCSVQQVLDGIYHDAGSHRNHENVTSHFDIAVAFGWWPHARN